MACGPSVSWPRKDHEILVAALAKIRDLSWQAQLVGKPTTPPLQANLRRQIEDLHLTDQGTLTGLLDDADVIDRYREAPTVGALAKGRTIAQLPSITKPCPNLLTTSIGRRLKGR